MSHPVPGHEYGENEAPDEAGYTTHTKKTAMAKSMARHRSKVGKEHKGLYPGFAQDMMNKMRKSIKK